MKSLLFFFLVLITSIQADTKLVGFASNEINFPSGVPLAGYGSADRRLKKFYDWENQYPYATLFKPSTGKDASHPIRVKTALFFDKNNEQDSVLFISVDFIGITARFKREVAKDISNLLNIKEDHIIISATHTHSGPGALAKNRLLSLIAVDMYQQEIFNIAKREIITTSFISYLNLKKVELYKLQVDIKDLQKNRMGKEGVFDPIATVLFTKDYYGQQVTGGLVHFSVHATGLGANNLHLNSDIPGSIEKSLQKLFGSNSHFLYLNGAQGDVTPTHRGREGLHIYEDSFGKQIEAKLKSSHRIKLDWNVKSEKIFIGFPRLNIKACIREDNIARFIWSKFNIPLFGNLPLFTRISQIRLGDLDFFTWPGEPTTMVGEKLKSAMRRMAVQNPIVLALTNDYLAYFTTEEELKNRTYESCSSLYGPKSTQRLIKSHLKLMKMKTYLEK